MLATLLFLASLVVAPASGGDAPAMFRHDAARLGEYTAPPAAHAYGGLAWAVRTDGSIHASPVVARGVAYVGSSDGHLYALGVRDGRRRWRTKLGDAVGGSVAVVRDTAYVQTVNGTFAALRTPDGTVRWRRSLGPPARLAWGFESGDYYASSPAVVGDTLVVGGADGFVYRLDATTGRTVWKFATGGRVRSSPAVANGVVYAGSFDGYVYALDLGSGALRWRHATNGAALESGKFGYDRRSVQSSPAVADGVVAVGSRDGWLYGLDAATGRRLWDFDNHLYWVNSSPAIRDGRVYAGNSDARMLQCADLRTGREIWRFDTALQVFASPALTSDTAYVTDFAGRLYAVDLATGKERWHVFIDTTRSVSSPVVADDRVLFGTDDGWIYAARIVPSAAALRRAVYWEPRDAKLSLMRAGETLRDAFVARGFERLGAPELAAFLRARIADRAPSVIVFALDDLPSEVRDGAGFPALLRTYLDAGGKVVWPGVPPYLAAVDRATGEGSIAAIDRAHAAQLLGVSFAPANFDPLAMTATGAGSAWGLHGWFLGAWSADPHGVAVLATDENGHAGAWVRAYGGRPGTGFVRIPVTAVAATPTNVASLVVAADYRPDP